METIKIYNTLSGKKEIFKPQKGKKINLFVEEYFRVWIKIMELVKYFVYEFVIYAAFIK